jgi:hypothetical protein
MQKKTKSILEELDSMYNDHYAERDKKYFIESRAQNVLASAIRLMDQIDETFDPESAENLKRKLINAIKQKDPGKFTRSVRRTDADS